MLPKKQRIPRDLFPLLIKGKTFINKLFLLRVVSSKDQDKRFGFSVSKKVAKSAVVRNRWRRVGYRLLRPFIPQIKPNTLATISFLTIPKDNEQVSLNLEAILKESNLIS